MGILDSGNWKLIKAEPTERRAQRGQIRLTISKKLISLSAEARKAMGKPPYAEVWLGKEDGRVLIISRNKKCSDVRELRDTKDGRIHFHDQTLVTALTEHLILHGKVNDHIGNDDKPLRGAYFCVNGKPYKEKDPNDGRKWLTGVEFDLKDAYACQTDLKMIEKAQATLKKKREEKKADKMKADQMKEAPCD